MIIDEIHMKMFYLERNGTIFILISVFVENINSITYHIQKQIVLEGFFFANYFKSEVLPCI